MICLFFIYFNLKKKSLFVQFNLEMSLFFFFQEETSIAWKKKQQSKWKILNIYFSGYFIFVAD